MGPSRTRRDRISRPSKSVTTRIPPAITPDRNDEGWPRRSSFREVRSLFTPSLRNSVLVLEDSLDAHAEDPGQPEGQEQRRDVLPGLERDDRLPRDADALGQGLLSHLAVLEPQLPDQAGERAPGIGFRR